MVWSISPPLVLGATFLRLCRGFLPFANLWLMKLIIDNTVPVILRRSHNLRHIWLLMLLSFAFLISGDMLARSIVVLDSILADLFSTHVNERIILHSAKLQLAAFENPVFYDKLERARRQASGRLGLLPSILNSCQDLISLLLLSSGMILFSSWLPVLLVASLVPAFLGEIHFTKLGYSLFFRTTPERRQLDYLRYLGTSVQSIKEVKVFGLTPYILGKYRNLAEEFLRQNRALTLRRASLGWALGTISTAGYCGAYILILSTTLAGGLTIGTFAFLTQTFSRSQTYVERILSSFADISEDALSLGDLFEFLDMEYAVHASPTPLSVPRPFRQGFEFRRVSFAYPQSQQYVLKNLNFHLAPHDKIALVGSNGAGKTTLVKLILRLYEPSEGEILLDGINLREYDVEDLRREIGIIFQDYMRYDMRLRENIGFGQIDFLSDDSRLEFAAHKSGASCLIERLPAGFDQMLGRRFDSGVELSGGEWQKVALARAYMRTPQLLILDEPTATLDANAEYEVFRRFLGLTENRPAILISHRFSTVRMAERIIVLANGNIQEEGSHEELLALRGRYARLFEMQAAGYR
jgi:ATP-binding cassette subfamily B protein